MKKIIILGSCGSIGTQTLDILSQTSTDFKIEAISVGSNLDLALQLIKKYKPNLVCTKKKEDIAFLKDGYNTNYTYGDAGLIEVATYKKEEDILLVQALVGSVGLKPTISAIKIKRNIALANKEVLVMAGDIVMNLVKEYNVKLLPLDSEHSAIWQCMQGENYSDVKRLIITASGGALRDYSLEELNNVTKSDVLNHPNWSMGAKITVDSATMMNKGFEVIEAHYLFNIDYSKIDTILHKESIVHSFVEFNDGQLKAQLGSHDMRLPILYALNYPKRIDIKKDNFNLINLSFKELSKVRFECLDLAYKAGIKGNIYPTVLNASNEAAVKLFLNDKINFTMIVKIIKEYLNKYSFIENLNIDQIIQIDHDIQNEITLKYGGEN